MTSPLKTLHIALWVVQVVLAATFAWAAVMKLSTPIPQLAVMWPWVGQVSSLLVKGTGIIDLLGGLGLVLPAALRVKPLLTPLAALGLVLLMVCAIVFHVMRGEAHLTGFNIVVVLLCIFVAWGRYKRAPVSPR
ncbi:hypothetical protein DCC81_16290 [Chitinophaga parva]|uniref:DoxX family protein n=2 Tax=Chitinophaga parva TaxID=2169414 RepID=A0A2T7BHQ9_9BACT|nr:hypothetical protein DCC81_16290 [Chitinophaga parva]